MAAYLTLTHKVTGNTYNGSKLIAVDAMLCEHLGIVPDPVDWHAGWMDWAGFALAVRADKGAAGALSHFMEPSCFGDAPPERVAICQWFIDNFDPR